MKRVRKERYIKDIENQKISLNTFHISFSEFSNFRCNISKNIKYETDVNIEKKRADGTGGAVGGAVAGGALGGAGALLLELGVLTILGVGPFLAVGPIVATLAGIVAGGAIGGVYAALVDLGFSKTDAKVYGGYLDQGNILVLVDEKDCRDSVCDSFRENDCLNKDMLI